MAKVLQFLDVNNIITIIVLVITMTFSWAKLENTASEIKIFRAQDVERILKLENQATHSENRISAIEKNNIETTVDLRHIRVTLEEIKTAVKGK